MDPQADSLQKEFDKRNPWVTKFPVDGVDYGGHYDALNDPRVPMFLSQFPNTKSVLELSCLEGGHSLALAMNPGVERVLAMEGRQVNVDKARFVTELFGVPGIEFQTVDLDEGIPTDERFDAIFCAGLLYHLPRPWKLIEEFPRVSDRVYVWTHYALDKDCHDQEEGYQGRLTREVGLSHPLSGLTQRSYWPTLDSLQQMFRDQGFTEVNVLNTMPENPAGPSVNLIARRD